MENTIRRTVARQAPRQTARQGTHYQSRTAKHAPEHTKTDYRETIMAQCMVCAIITACMLVLCMVNVPTTQGIRANLKQSIATNADINALTDTWASMGNLKQSLASVLSGEGAQTTQPEAVPTIALPTTAPLAPTADIDFSIDTDILKDLTQQDAFANTAVKK